MPPGGLILIVLAVGAIIGYSHGLIAAGLALLGLIIGYHIATVIALGSPGWGLLGALIGALAGASLLGGIGRRARQHAHIPGLRLADGVLGGALGAGTAIITLWFLAPTFAAIPLPPAIAPGLAAAQPIVTRIEHALGLSSRPGPGHGHRARLGTASPRPGEPAPASTPNANG